MICQILRLFVSILAANDKHLDLNRGKLTIPIQMELSQKSKAFSGGFSAFLKSGLDLEYFEKKKMSLIDVILPKLRTPKTRLYK